MWWYYATFDLERKASEMHFYELLDIYSDTLNPQKEKFSPAACLSLGGLCLRTQSQGWMFCALPFLGCILPAVQGCCTSVPDPPEWCRGCAQLSPGVCRLQSLGWKLKSNPQLPAQLSESGRLEGGGCPDPSATRKGQTQNESCSSLEQEEEEEGSCLSCNSLFIPCSFPLPHGLCSASGIFSAEFYPIAEVT